MIVRYIYPNVLSCSKSRRWHAATVDASQPAGSSLAVRLTPKGGRDAIDGIEQLADGRAC